jgi:hypothetical protein
MEAIYNSQFDSEKLGELPWQVQQAILSREGQDNLNLQDEYVQIMVGQAANGSQITLDEVEETSWVAQGSAALSWDSAELALDAIVEDSSQDVLKNLAIQQAYQAAFQSSQIQQFNNLASSNYGLASQLEAVNSNQAVSNAKLRSLQVQNASNGQQLSRAVAALNEANRRAAEEEIATVRASGRNAITRFYLANVSGKSDNPKAKQGILAEPLLAPPF